MTREELMELCAKALNENPEMPVASVQVCIQRNSIRDSLGDVFVERVGAWRLYRALHKGYPWALKLVDNWAKIELENKLLRSNDVT